MKTFYLYNIDNLRTSDFLEGEKAFVIGTKGQANSDLDYAITQFPVPVKIVKRFPEMVNQNYLGNGLETSHILQPAIIERV
jgi:hypothetical protein